MPCIEHTTSISMKRITFFFLRKKNKDSSSSSGCLHCVTDGCELLVASPLSLKFWDYRSVTTPGYKADFKKPQILYSNRK